MKKIKWRSILLLMLDLFFVVLSITLSTMIRFEFNMPRFFEQRLLLEYLPIILIIYLIVFKLFKVDKTIWSKISIDEAMKIVSANLTVTVVLLILRITKILNGFPISVILISGMLITLLQVGTRIAYRYYRIVTIRSIRKKDNSKRILIYGAGSAGQMIAKEILENESIKYNLVGFIDDNPSLKNQVIFSTPVFGDMSELPSVIDQYAIDGIFLAVPSLSLSKQKDIISQLVKYKIDVQKVSSTNTLLQEGNMTNSLRKIDIQDLLERQEISINNDEIKNIIHDKTILVTGAGGSIGSELVRQIVKHDPKRIVLLDFNETDLYALQQELIMKIKNKELNPLDKDAHIGSIRDYQSMQSLFRKENFDVVFHAAAHKHVPLMENAAEEAVKNNIFGTKNLIDLANKYKVERFINISTDKAVNPTNVMGATKRFIEMMLQSQNGNTETKFVAVRFGNVLGSNGSAVPLFQKQIEKGGPVTVTHKDIERYFMTIPEAVRLVLQAASYAEGGEIFVLDMGEAVKILHLAEKVIELSGYVPYEDIDIEITGLRPGEKLYEELLMDEENLRTTDNKLIHVAKPLDIKINDIDDKLIILRQAVKADSNDAVIASLKEVVPTYKTEGELINHV